MQDKKLCKIQRLLLLSPMSRMAMQHDREFRFRYRERSDEKSDSTVASKGSSAGWWKRQHRMGTGRMWALSLPLVRQATFQRCTNLQNMQETSRWSTGWISVKESQKIAEVRIQPYTSCQVRWRLLSEFVILEFLWWIRHFKSQSWILESKKVYVSVSSHSPL